MAKRDAIYTSSSWISPSLPYLDIEWLQASKKLPNDDVVLPAGYYINPDEIEENSISGPSRDKVIDLFHEISSSSLTEETIESFRKSWR